MAPPSPPHSEESDDLEYNLQMKLSARPDPPPTHNSHASKIGGQVISKRWSQLSLLGAVLGGVSLEYICSNIIMVQFTKPRTKPKQTSQSKPARFASFLYDWAGTQNTIFWWNKIQSFSFQGSPSYPFTPQKYPCCWAFQLGGTPLVWWQRNIKLSNIVWTKQDAPSLKSQEWCPWTEVLTVTWRAGSQSQWWWQWRSVWASLVEIPKQLLKYTALSSVISSPSYNLCSTRIFNMI